MSHRIATLSVLLLGVGAFVVVGKLVIPIAIQGAARTGQGEDVVRYLPGPTWTTERTSSEWRFSLTEVALHRDYSEVCLLIQNKSRRAATLGVDPVSRIVVKDSPAPIPTTYRVATVTGDIPLAPALTTLEPGGVRTVRLRFATLGNTDHLWHMDLKFLREVVKKEWQVTGCGFDFDLRTKKSP